MNENSQQVMTRSWSEIHAFYMKMAARSESASVKGMGDLVSLIINSRYASGLHAWTSMHDLCVVQTPVTHPYGGPYLRVIPRQDGRLEFRYVDTPNASAQWHRTVTAHEGFDRLVRFLDQLHWFV